MDMVLALANLIEEECIKAGGKDTAAGLEAGQNMYRALFVNTRAYKRHKSGVDTILITDGYSECIVTE